MVTYRLQIPCWGLVQRSCRSFSWCVDTSCWVNGMRIPQTRQPFNSPEKCSTMPETAWKLPITNVESVDLYTSLYWFLENKHQRFDYNNGLGGITPSRRDLHCKYEYIYIHICIVFIQSIQAELDVDTSCEYPSTWRWNNFIPRISCLKTVQVPILSTNKFVQNVHPGNPHQIDEPKDKWF